MEDYISIWNRRSVFGYYLSFKQFLPIYAYTISPQTTGNRFFTVWISLDKLSRAPRDSISSLFASMGESRFHLELIAQCTPGSLLFRLILKPFFCFQDTYVAESNQVGDFIAYFCAALLLNWSAELRAMDFQGIIVFLQHLPTENWTLVEVRQQLFTAVFLFPVLTLRYPCT
jgi:hypothetical protein